MIDWINGRKEWLKYIAGRKPKRNKGVSLRFSKGRDSDSDSKNRVEMADQLDQASSESGANKEDSWLAG